MIQLQENIWTNPNGGESPSICPKGIVKALMEISVALLKWIHRLLKKMARAICADLDRMSKAQDERIRQTGYEPRCQCYFR